MTLKPACVLVCASVLGMAQSSSSPNPAPPQTVSPAQNSNSTGPTSTQPPGSTQPATSTGHAPTTEQAKTPASDGKVAAASKAKKGKEDSAPKAVTSIEEARTTYLIGPLDVLSIKVWNNANLTGIVDVRPDGMLSLPLVGEVKAAGLTVQQLRAELSKRISEAGQISPDVDVQVAKVNSKKFYVTGGVRKGGEFPLPEPITVLDALSLTGGFTDFANQKKIYVLRDGHQYFFNYKEVIKGKNPEQNIVVQNGDHIVIPE